MVIIISLWTSPHYVVVTTWFLPFTSVSLLSSHNPKEMSNKIKRALFPRHICKLSICIIYDKKAVNPGFINKPRPRIGVVPIFHLLNDLPLFLFMFRVSSLWRYLPTVSDTYFTPNVIIWDVPAGNSNNGAFIQDRFSCSRSLHVVASDDENIIRFSNIYHAFKQYRAPDI